MCTVPDPVWPPFAGGASTNRDPSPAAAVMPDKTMSDPAIRTLTASTLCEQLHVCGGWTRTDAHDRYNQDNAVLARERLLQRAPVQTKYGRGANGST